MSISIIFAMAENGVIGANNSLPWKLPADMRWFRQHTLGKTIVMGRKTFESFGAKPLPERRNIILTRDPNYSAPKSEIADSIEAVISNSNTDDELMIIGGSTIYEQSLALANTLYMTLIHAKIEGDAYFPSYDQSEWAQRFCERHEVDDKHAHAYSFYIFDRK